LDFSGCKKLKELKCEANQLTSLNVSKNTILSKLNCSANKLISIDLSGCSELIYLSCYGNNLASLDVSECTSLTELDFSFNDLTEIDITKNVVLTSFHGRNNKLTKLDVSNNLALINLYCYENEIKNLDVSNNPNLTRLWCYSNALESLNIQNGNNYDDNYEEILYLTVWGNPKLSCIQVDDSVWSVINSSWTKDTHTVYSENCGYTYIEEEANSINDITLSPNPASDYIELSGVAGEVKLFDVLGSLVISNPLNTPCQGDLCRIDVSSLSPGVYFVSVGGRMYKFVKM